MKDCFSAAPHWRPDRAACLLRAHGRLSMHVLRRSFFRRKRHGFCRARSGARRPCISARCRQSAADGAGHRQIEVGIVHYHERILRTHFELHLGEVLHRRRRNTLAHGDRAENEIALMPGLSIKAWPTREPEPMTRLNKPLGMSWREMISARITALAGVRLAGFHTTALPKASAGAIFHEAVAIGKFHGDMMATTPIGSRRTSISMPSRTESAVSPTWRRVSAA